VKMICLVAGVAAVMTLAACSTSSSAKSPAQSSGGKLALTVAIGSAGTYITPLILAKSLGYASDEGLDLTYNVVGVNVLNVVLAGQADIGSGGVGTPLPAIKNGKNTKIIYAVESGAVSASVLGTSKIKTFADCTKIGTSVVGSNAYASTQAYIKAVGTKPRVTTIPMTASLVPSILSGSNDCAVNATASLLKGVAAGLHFVVDPHNPSTMPSQAPLAATGVVLFGDSANLTKKHDAVVKYMKALDRAVQFMTTSTSTQVATELAKDENMKAFTADQLKSLFESDKPFLVPNKGVIDAATWTNNQQLYSVALPELASGDSKWAYTNVVDASYVQAAAG
jgi:ABC-type nitrate/sulfonate/bicarbonate transport system substrate-binding protein